MPKQTVNKKAAVKKPTAAKPKAKTAPKPRATTKPKAKTTTKPKPRTKTKPTPEPVVVVDKEVEFPHDMFPWKLVYKDRTEKRTCYFQCEEHRKKHVTRYNLTKKDILFIGYKYDD